MDHVAAAVPETGQSSDGDNFETIAQLPPGADPAVIEAGYRALIVASGEDAERPDMATVPRTAARAALAMTTGYDSDVADVLAAGELAVVAERATLDLSMPVRTVCERCLLPLFGTVVMRCKPHHRNLDGGHLARLVGVLATRLQSESQLAEQIASALVDLGGGAWARVKVSARRPCDECGAGHALTTARARRTEPAGGDTPQEAVGG